MSAPLGNFFEMKVKAAVEEDSIFGNIELWYNGTLCISKRDGITKLTPEEANILGNALQAWAKRGGVDDLG